MEIYNEDKSLLFDADSEECLIHIERMQGEFYAFIICLYLDAEESRLIKPEKRRYWGRFSFRQEAESIRRILASGAEWPELPRAK